MSFLKGYSHFCSATGDSPSTPWHGKPFCGSLQDSNSLFRFPAGSSQFQEGMDVHPGRARRGKPHTRVCFFPYPLLLESLSEPANFLFPCSLRSLLLGKAAGNLWWRCLSLCVNTEVHRVPLSQLKVTRGIWEGRGGGGREGREVVVQSIPPCSYAFPGNCLSISLLFFPFPPPARCTCSGRNIGLC